MLQLRYLRDSQNLTQRELAQKLGISASNISKYEIWLLEPNLDILQTYAFYFSVSIDFILGLTPNPKGTATDSKKEKSFIYLFGSDGVGEEINIPQDKVVRLRQLLLAAMPELFTA